MDVTWDIRREGRAWSADEFQVRKELLPEKLEVDAGKLLWSEEDRVKLLGLLLENVGADATVRLGNANVWISASLNNSRTFFGDRFNRWMLVLFCLHLFTLAGLWWYLLLTPRPGGRVAEVLLGVALGVFVSLGVNAFIRD